MNDAAAAPTSAGYRSPAEVIAHAVWLCSRFALGYRDVEGLLAERGVVVTYEAIRRWSRKFGQTYANALRRRRPRPGDRWRADAVFVGINGVQHSLRRAVGQQGHVLAILVRSRRNKAAAKRFLRKLLQGLQDVPRVLVTDKLASYGAAKRAILPDAERRQHRRLNNRAETSHQPTRERERRMRRPKPPGHAPRSPAAYGPIASHCRPRRHRLTAEAYRETGAERFATRRAVTGTSAIA